MALEIIDPTADNLALTHFLSVTANVLEKYNNLLSADDIVVDDVTKILSQTSEAFSQYTLIKNSVLDLDLSRVDELKNSLDIMIEDINTKLTNGYFVGSQGVKGDKGDQGIQGVKGDKGDQGIAGTTDYINLDNKPDLSFYSSLVNANSKIPKINSIISDSVQLDSIKVNGMYRVDPCDSLPTSVHHALIIFGNGSNVVSQIAVNFITGSAYVRSFNNSWSPWVALN